MIFLTFTTLSSFTSRTRRNLHLNVIFSLLLAIACVVLVSKFTMAQESTEAVGEAAEVAVAEGTADADANGEETAEEVEKEPYKVVDYRNFFGIDGRLIVWIIAQLHLLFAAFVLAVPLFVTIIEIIGIKTKDKTGADFVSLRGNITWAEL